MRRSRPQRLFFSCLGGVLGSVAQPLDAQTVTNVRAQQLPDRTVEVLYDLAGDAAVGPARDARAHVAVAVATKIDNDPDSKRSDIYVLGPSGVRQGAIGY